MLLNCKSVVFYSMGDEKNFFDWLNSIEGVNKVWGQGFSTMIETEDELNDESLRELLAIFYKYKINMKPLKSYLTSDNRIWFFSNPKAYWHNKVFRKR